MCSGTPCVHTTGPNARPRTLQKANNSFFISRRVFLFISVCGNVYIYISGRRQHTTQYSNIYSQELPISQCIPSPAAVSCGVQEVQCIQRFDAVLSCCCCCSYSAHTTHPTGSWCVIGKNLSLCDAVSSFLYTSIISNAPTESERAIQRNSGSHYMHPF